MLTNKKQYEVWDSLNKVVIEIKATCKIDVIEILTGYFKMPEGYVKERFKI